MNNQISVQKSEPQSPSEGVAMKQIAHASMMTASATMFAMILALAKGKAIASILGPEGIGLAAQLSNLQLLMAGLASFGMSLGLSKFVSQHLASGNYGRLANTWVSARLICLLSSVSILVVVVIFLQPLSVVLTGDSSTQRYLLIVGIAIPISALSSLYGGFLSGTRSVKSIASISIISAVGSLVVTLPLVILLGLIGVVIQITLSAGITLTMSIYYGRKAMQDWAPQRTILRIYRSESVELLAFGAFSLFTVIAHQLTLLYAQTIVIHQEGLSANGLFQSTWGIWWPIIALSMSSISLYVLPGISASTDDDHIQRQVNASLRLLLLVTTPITFVVVLFSRDILYLVYSPEFSQAAILLQLMAVGTAFRMIAFPLAMRFVAKGQLKFPLMGEGIWYLSLAISMSILLPVIGLTATGIAVFLSQVVYMLFVLLGAKYLFGISYYTQNLKASATSLALPVCLMLSMLALSATWFLLVAIVLLIVWLVLVPDKSERSWLVNRLRHGL